MMTTTYIIAAIAFIIIIAVIYIVFKMPKQKKDSNVEYTKALNYLITGEKNKALQKLRETVRLDTNNIDAYIKIGDILREQGSPDRAIKIHRGLTIRPELRSSHKITILESLIKDYQAAEKYDLAVQAGQKLLEITNHDAWAEEIMLQLYEGARDWEKAYETLKKIQKLRGQKNSQLLALYKVESGLKLIEQGKERDGRIKFREAIKLDKKCPPAYLYLSDSYIRENRYSDALTELERFSTQTPQLSYLGFARIKDILFHEGIFGEVENIFESLLQKNPNIESIRFQLADIYERKGELEQAIQLCLEALEQNPGSQQAKRYLAKFLAKKGETEEALQYALDLTENLMNNKEEQFACKKCSFVSNEPKWRCPQCHEWNTFL